MKRISLTVLLAAGLFSVPSYAQDIILLNQDGEKVGVAKESADEAEKKDTIIIKPGDSGTAKVENGVITVVEPDGTTKQFKMSDARSVTIRRSSQSVVGEDGVRKETITGKAVLIGPDGVRREIDLGTDSSFNSVVGDSNAPITWMIGVTCSSVSPVLRSQLQLDDGTGLVVNRVLQGGAAEKAGVKANDILMFGDQQPISSSKELTKIVNEAGSAGNEVAFTLLRGGEEVSISVMPTEREGVRQMMVELGPDFDGFGMKLPALDGDLDFEFKQFGPGIIIGEGFAGDRQLETMDKLTERFNRIQKEMDEMRRRMRGEDR